MLARRKLNRDTGPWTVFFTVSSLYYKDDPKYRVNLLIRKIKDTLCIIPSVYAAVQYLEIPLLLMALPKDKARIRTMCGNMTYTMNQDLNKKSTSSSSASAQNNCKNGFYSCDYQTFVEHKTYSWRCSPDYGKEIGFNFNLSAMGGRKRPRKAAWVDTKKNERRALPQQPTKCVSQHNAARGRVITFVYDSRYGNEWRHRKSLQRSRHNGMAFLKKKRVSVTHPKRSLALFEMAEEKSKNIKQTAYST